MKQVRIMRTIAVVGLRLPPGRWIVGRVAHRLVAWPRHAPDMAAIRAAIVLHVRSEEIRRNLSAGAVRARGRVGCRATSIGRGQHGELEYTAALLYQCGHSVQREVRRCEPRSPPRKTKNARTKPMRPTRASQILTYHSTQSRTPVTGTSAKYSQARRTGERPILTLAHRRRQERRVDGMCVL